MATLRQQISHCLGSFNSLNTLLSSSDCSNRRFHSQSLSSQYN